MSSIREDITKMKDDISDQFKPTVKMVNQHEQQILA
jgi:hypothetical protein